MKPARKKNEKTQPVSADDQLDEALISLQPVLAEYLEKKQELITSSKRNQVLCSKVKKATGELNATIGSSVTAG